MEPLRLGVIGCGVIGGVHAKAAASLDCISLVALADVREDAAKKLAEECGVDHVYTTAEALLDDPNVEAVVLAMPARPRTELACQAFAKGKHVLTEKPVAPCAADVEKMIAARGDLVGACCSARYRMTRSAKAATDFIASGALGKLRLVRARGIIQARPAPEKTPPPWRLNRAMNGGGILMNWGCYDLDYMLGVTGWTLKPKTVLGQAWGVPSRFVPNVAPDSDAESFATGLALCEDGIVLLIERGEYMPAPAETAWQVIGEDGSIALQMRTGDDIKLVHTEADTQNGVVEHVVWEGSEEHGCMSTGVLEDLAAAIREKRDPATPLEKALIVQKITDAVYASGETGAPVEIT